MQIDGTEIGPRHPPFIIAEISCNHMGSKATALKLIDAAAAAGASSVKFQVFNPQRLATQRGGADMLLTEGLWAGRTLGELYQACHTPYEWVHDMVEACHGHGLTWFSSVFHVDDVDFFETLEIPAYKTASFEVGHTSLQRKCGSTGKPVIISSGSDEGNATGHALKATLDGGTCSMALLHCVSAYPCPIENANLARIQRLARTYGVHVGWSDHTVGTTAAIAAIGMGACIVEKHIKLNEWDETPDAPFSSSPYEMMSLVKRCQDAWAACQPSGQIEPYRQLKSQNEEQELV